ncbi:acyltransferase family protein [Hyphomicrobium sp.]|uniref:acyltransferase family protein n=1 Tax=Hyphomicrobium sp. TaxID=82 RepID=UPI002E316445|nr:acyltransferase family protein [Hyphomicrobium sp.]HEX2842963.1 acyltransferase family protein [Hyphomicrobium sp.]
MRLSFLDGLRGWGAVFVLNYHVFCSGLAPYPPVAHELRSFIPFSGLVAVLTFFLVSGFALSVKFLSKNDPLDLVRIAAGRYPRLVLPIFAICAVVHVVWMLGFLAPPVERLEAFQRALTVEPTLGHLLRFSFWDVFANYSSAKTYVGPLWTMQTELMGSFLVVGALLVVGRLPMRMAVMGVLSAVLMGFDNPLALFALGVVFADAFQRGWFEGRPAWIGVVLILVGFAAPLVLEPHINAANMIGVSALFLGCVLLAPVARALSGKLSRHLGYISFPLYLVHGPVMMIVGAPLMLHYGVTVGDKIAIDLFVVVLSFAAAYAFAPINDRAIVISRWIGDAIGGLMPARAEATRA